MRYWLLTLRIDGSSTLSLSRLAGVAGASSEFASRASGSVVGGSSRAPGSSPFSPSPPLVTASVLMPIGLLKTEVGLVNWAAVSQVWLTGVPFGTSRSPPSGSVSVAVFVGRHDESRNVSNHDVASVAQANAGAASTRDAKTAAAAAAPLRRAFIRVQSQWGDPERVGLSPVGTRGRREGWTIVRS